MNMLLAVCLANKRNAIGDSYKNLINRFELKENIICGIPYAYEIMEFSQDFIKREKSCFLHKPSKGLGKIFNIFWEIKEIMNILKKAEVRYLFLYTENVILCPLLGIVMMLFYKKIKVTCYIHDPILHIGESRVRKFNRILNSFLLYPRVNQFVVSYKMAKCEFSNIYGIIKEKIIVLPLPRMPEMEFEEIKEKESEILYDFIFFGRIEKYKGLDLLIHAFSDEKLRKFKLLIVGDGRESNNIKNEIQGKPNIIFINTYLSNKILAKKIMQSKVVILPYKVATGSQTVQIANYYHRMVLAARTGCFTEYIEEGRNGFFIEEHSIEAIQKAVLDIMKKDLRIFENSIEESLKRFDIDRISHALETIIHKETKS